MIHMKYQHEKVQILSHLEIIVLPHDGYEIFIYISIVHSPVKRIPKTYLDYSSDDDILEKTCYIIFETK